MENKTQCPICLKSFQGIRQHLRLKHQTTPEDLYENPPTSTDPPTLNTPKTAGKPRDWDHALDRMIERLEKLYFVRIMSDAISGKQDLGSMVQNLKGNNVITKTDLLDMLERGMEIGSAKAEDPGDAAEDNPDPLNSLLNAALSNPALVEKLLGGLK